MTTRYLVLEGFTPTSLNRLKGHWSKSYRLKRADKLAIALTARDQQVPQATGRRLVALYVTLAKGQRAPDPDNLWKSLLDALVEARLLVDDGPLYCLMGRVEYSRGPRRRTVVALTDLDAGG